MSFGIVFNYSHSSQLFSPLLALQKSHLPINTCP